MASESSTTDPDAALEPTHVATGLPARPAMASGIDDLFGGSERSASTRFLLFNAVPSWLISMSVHVLVLLALGLMYVDPVVESITTVLSISNSPLVEEIKRFEIPDEIEPLEVQEFSSKPLLQVQSEVPQEAAEIGVTTELDAAPMALDLMEFGERTAPKSDLMQELGAIGGSGLDGRGAKMRGELTRKFGGTKGSEEAVALALKWFVEHQLPDGSWSFDHRRGRCANRCGHAGRMKDCYTGATAMALLPFLGAGQTHVEGAYQGNVTAGLAFLIRSMKSNGSLIQGRGNMYAHGLAAIALCEAYAMTQDRKLLAPAQASLNFIVFAQDPIGGGWRYVPHQPGDTSAVGWQLMALKSGHMAYLKVPNQTILGVNRFLNSVQANGGANYGYMSPGAKPSTTAIGLLCRMYLGWNKDHEPLRRGVEFLSRRGPSDSDMYYNYYATQVLRHYGGEEWNAWNSAMRDQLVGSQSKNGHARGSWDVPSGGHVNGSGGRLYFSSMATMILEVYYRHMPIYGQQAAEDDFPL